MSVPTIADFPALGFIPAAGDAEAASALSDKLAKAVASLQEGYQLINELANSDSADWQGSAAQEFRSHLSGDPPKALLNAHDSMAKAQSALSAWGPVLESMQGVAQNYEFQAEEAKAALEQAQSNYEQAQQNPNLGTFNSIEINVTPQQIQAAGDARAQLLQCESQLQEYQAQLEAIIRQAQELEQGHNQQAGQVAEQLQSAPNGLAPHRPGLFHRAMSWLHSHAKVIGDVLSDLAGVCALLALIPPLTVVCGPLSIALSAAALGMHLWGGDHNLMDLGGDVMGMIPGVDEVSDAFKGAKLAVKGIDVADKGITDTIKVASSGFGKAFVESAGKFADAGKPSEWIAKKLVSAPSVTRVWYDTIKVANVVSKATNAVTGTVLTGMGVTSTIQELF